MWSKNSHSAYIFEGVFGALFFLIEENGYCNFPDKYLKLLDLEKNPTTLNVIEQINKLLYQKESYKKEMKKEIYLVSNNNISIDSTFSTKGLVCFLYDTFFYIYCDEELEMYIYPIFKYLKSKSENIKNISYIFGVKVENGYYNLYVNNKKKRVTKKENIIIVLMDLIRITLYINSDYLVALHAASLIYKNKLFIFPGISGAGKSTLSSFLMYNEFQLCSDEVTIIDKGHNIKPIPLPITIKEGSWNIIKNFVKNFNVLPIYKRLDGQNIKFITPITAVNKKVTFSDTIIIFPQYEEKSSTKLKKLTIIEALKLLKDTQYQLKDPYDFDMVKNFLNFLFSNNKYMLTYSDLSQAMDVITKLKNE